MMDKRREGIRCGIPSYCSANELVLEIALRRAKELNKPVLIEATANQVNQFGGYTGMKPADTHPAMRSMTDPQSRSASWARTSISRRAARVSTGSSPPRSTIRA